MKSPVAATLVIGAALAVVAARPAAAQNPTPGQAQQLLQQAQQNPALAEQLRQRLLQSGLTPDQIRARLRASGYPDSLLDAYLGPGGAMGGPQRTPGAFELAAIRAVGLPPIELTQGQLPVDTGLIRARAESAQSRVFGVDVFRRSKTQFLPLLSGPVPPDYRIGPGDVLALIITGDVEGEPEGHERDPDDARRNGELGGDEPQAALPQRRPQGQRGRQQTAREQPLRGAPRVPWPVVARDEQPDDERRGVLPAVEVAGGEECRDRPGDDRAERFAFSDEAMQLAQRRERHEVRGEQHQESQRGALQMAPQVARRAALQVHRGACRTERHERGPRRERGARWWRGYGASPTIGGTGGGCNLNRRRFHDDPGSEDCAGGPRQGRDPQPANDERDQRLQTYGVLGPSDSQRPSAQWLAWREVRAHLCA